MWYIIFYLDYNLLYYVLAAGAADVARAPARGGGRGAHAS
jgi:hypothetical protein